MSFSETLFRPTYLLQLVEQLLLALQGMSVNSEDFFIFQQDETLLYE
jgi:hypothetical protein